MTGVYGVGDGVGGAGDGEGDGEGDEMGFGEGEGEECVSVSVSSSDSAVKNRTVTGASSSALGLASEDVALSRINRRKKREEGKPEAIARAKTKKGSAPLQSLTNQVEP
jgi:hypothetical protein